MKLIVRKIQTYTYLLQLICYKRKVGVNNNAQILIRNFHPRFSLKPDNELHDQ